MVTNQQLDHAALTSDSPTPTADQYQNNQQIAFDSILGAVNWAPAHDNTVTIKPTATALACAYPIADMASATMRALACAVTDLHSLRSGVAQQASIDRTHASLAMATAEYLRVDGEIPPSWDPLTRYYRSADNHWIYLHTAFEHLRDGALKLLQANNDADAVASAVARVNADEFESTAIERGLTVAKLRTREQWSQHPHASAIDRQPLIRLTRVADAEPQMIFNDSSSSQRPLSGVRVLDLSRVIAGPMAGRALAEHGANVLQVASPKLPSVRALVIDTGHGKHCCHIDLNEQQQADTLRTLIADADVFINGYRPGALAQRGFSMEQLCQLRPGIICTSISAFSSEGPWAGRRGYDTLVQATTGLARDFGGEQPQRLPCQPLDYIAGYLGAFATIVAMLKRAEQGGSWHIEISLAGIASWIWRMNDAMQHESDPPASNLSFEQAQEFLTTADSPFGRLHMLGPVIELSQTKAYFSRPPVPLGHDPAQWPDS